MRILAAEPYAAPSHLLFLEGLAAHSAHELEIATVPARRWKWRMRTASLHFARLVERDGPWDLLFASDYLNLAETLALLSPGRRDLPAVVYFHENQLTYPLQAGEARDVHHGLTHVHAMLAARYSLFNSRYHRESFLAAAEELLALVPDVDTAGIAGTLRQRSAVLPLGTDVPAGRPAARSDAPVVLWPHRWEYDKDPGAFLASLAELEREDVPFRLRLAGQRFRERPAELDELERRFADRLVPGGYVDREQHLASLAECHVVASTARHEFFGLGTLEAIRSGLVPVLPRDLAYPELLPPEERTADRFLYERERGAAPALARAIAAVRAGAWQDERRALIDHTDGFAWERLAPRFDAVFEEAARS